MRLRELAFPIAVLRPNSLMGGRNAGLKTKNRYNFNIAQYYTDGAYDEARIFDSEGREFRVSKIIFDRACFVYYALERLDYLLIFKNPDPTDMVRVDMELELVRNLSLEQFCTELTQIALDHPNWWKRHSTRDEIEQMFKGTKTFAEAIDEIGVLDPPGKEKLPGKSTKVVDLRKKVKS